MRRGERACTSLEQQNRDIHVEFDSISCACMFTPTLESVARKRKRSGVGKPAAEFHLLGGVDALGIPFGDQYPSMALIIGTMFMRCTH